MSGRDRFNQPFWVVAFISNQGLGLAVSNQRRCLRRVMSLTGGQAQA